MKTRSRLKFTVLAGLLAALPALPAAHGQSSDALIEKLVKKGILTAEEAKDLRQESDQGFAKAYSAKSGLPAWVTKLKFDNDFRFRFEENNADNTAYSARDRYRYRLRLGAVATLGEDFDIGVRLASGNPQTNPGGTLVGGQSITANQDMNSLESRKFFWIDLAYAKWTPIKGGDWTISGSVGKLNQPFMLSNMVWDYDINPEGAAIQADYRINENHTLKTVGAFFVLDEINTGVGAVPTIGASHDPFVFGGQTVLESKWTPKFDTTVGVAAFDIARKDTLSALAQPFYNSGNSRLAGTDLLKYNMNPIIVSGSATYKLDSFPLYPGKFPLKVSGEYMNNPGAPSSNTGYNLKGQLGKAGKKGTWEISYRYQRLEADAWFDALVDDDNGAFYAAGNPQLVGTGKASGWFGGTNVRGHLMEGTYSFTDYLNFTFTYYLNSLIINTPGQSSNAGHFMANVMWKF